jgi:hypothetical protein
MDIDTTLRQAVTAAKAGRKAEARHLLETVLDADKRNEQAWLWMSGVVDSDEERIVCLENVLTINPNNQAARKGLVAFGVAPEIDQPSLTAISEEPSTDPPVTPAPASTESIDVDDMPLYDPTTSDRRPFIAITLVLVLMLICTVVSILAFVILSPPW